MGFAFALPFTPYYIQHLGVTDPLERNAWIAICFAATPCSLAFFAPIWGAVADRYGRRLMLLRANFAASVIVVLMGFVRHVETLAALRFLQGAFTGTMTAAQTMVAVHAPRHRSGLALGSLSAAVYSGAMVGAALGGVVADAFGYRAAFWTGGSILFLAGLLVLFASKEEFVRPERRRKARPWGARLREAKRSVVVPILFLIVCMAFVRQFDRPFLPLLVQEIHGAMKGAARITGGLNAVGGLAGLIAGFTLGRLADRLTPARVAVISALGASLFMAPHGFVEGFAALFGIRFGLIYFAGGLDPVFQIWLAKVTSPERRGVIFGWGATAKAVGWLSAPLLSGVVASVFDIRAVFFVGTGLYLALVPVIGLVVRRVEARSSLRRREAVGEEETIPPEEELSGL